MSAEWFCEMAGEELGPLTAHQLKSLVAGGRLKPEDRIRKGTQGKWVPASRVKGLFQTNADRPSQGQGDGSSKAPVVQGVPHEAVQPPAAQPVVPPPVPQAPMPGSVVPQAQAAPVPPQAPSTIPPVDVQPVTPVAANAAVPGEPFVVAANPSMVGGHPTSHVPAAPLDPERRKKQNQKKVVALAAVFFTLILVALVLVLANPFGGTGDSQTAARPAGDNASAVAEDLEGFDVSNTSEDAAAASDAAPVEPVEEQGTVEWIDASKSEIHRPAAKAKVRIVSVQLGKPEYLKRYRNPPPLPDSLLVTVEIRNLDETKLLDYRSFSQTRGLSLVDSIGNGYELEDLNPRAPIKGQVAKESVYPDRPMRDLLVFHRPLPKALYAYMMLELPAAALGTPGEPLRFKIPRTMITQVDESEDGADDALVREDSSRAAEVSGVEEVVGSGAVPAPAAAPVKSPKQPEAESDDDRFDAPRPVPGLDEEEDQKQAAGDDKTLPGLHTVRRIAG